MGTMNGLGVGKMTQEGKHLLFQVPADLQVQEAILKEKQGNYTKMLLAQSPEKQQLKIISRAPQTGNYFIKLNLFYKETHDQKTIEIPVDFKEASKESFFQPTGHFLKINASIISPLDYILPAI